MIFLRSQPKEDNWYGTGQWLDGSAGALGRLRGDAPTADTFTLR